MKRELYIIIFCIIQVNLLCTGPTAGSGTETTNGICGVLGDTSRTTEIIAAIYSVDYRPDSGLGIAESTIVKSDGSFTFTPPAGNRYNLFIWNSSGQLGICIPMLPSDTSLGKVALSPTGTISTDYFSGSGAAPGPAYEIIIPGSPFYYYGESQENITIPFIPPGEYDINIRLIGKVAGDTPDTITTVRSATVDPSVLDTTILKIP